MKIIFFGTPEYVVPIAQKLHNTYYKGKLRDLVGVVTQPPKPAGRKGKIERSAIDNWAYKRNVPIAHDYGQIPQADLGVVAAHGRIIPQSVINAFPYGIINIHPSKLPEFRGASPVQATIATGKTQAHVTFIKMDEQMDHGPIISQFKDDILKDDTTETLRSRLFQRATEALIEMLPAYTTGKIALKPQNHKKATYVSLIKKQDGYVPPLYLSKALKGEKVNEKWALQFIKDCFVPVTPTSINQFIRAMYPWPGAWTEIQIGNSKKRLKLLKVNANEERLVLDTVQLDGKDPVSWKQFIAGYPQAKLS